MTKTRALMIAMSIIVLASTSNAADDNIKGEAVPLSAPPTVVTWQDVEARQAVFEGSDVREGRLSTSDLAARMEYYDIDEFIAKRQRLEEFERLAQEAISRGEEPPRFWQSYDPNVDIIDVPLAEDLPGPALTQEHIDPATGDYGNQASRSSEASRAPTSFVDWQGLSDTGRPSDSALAVGQAHVGVMVNKELAFYTKDGSLARGPIDFEVWWPSSPGPDPDDLFDPKIIYDAHEDRWVMLVINGRGGDSETYYAVSVSQTSNPEGPWWNWYIRSDLDGGTNTAFWADYPGLGFDSGDATISQSTGGAIYITSNQYNNASPNNQFQYSKLRVYPKYQFYGGQSLSGWEFRNRTNADASSVFTWKPAATYSSTGSSPTEYILNTRSGGANWISKWTLTNPLASGPTLSAVTTISVNSYDIPPAANQLGGSGTIDGFNCRTQDVQYQNGFLYTSVTDVNDWGTPASLEVAIHIFKINATSNAVIWDNRFGADVTDYIFPNIMADANGDATIVMSRTSSTIYPQVRQTGRLSTDGSIQGSSLVKSGEATYNPTANTVERWGDYNGVAVDPCAGDRTGAWLMSQYSSSSSAWTTWIAGTSFGSGNVFHLLDKGTNGYDNQPRYFTWEMTSYDWSGLAIYNNTGDATANNDLAASSTCPFGTPYQNSNYQTVGVRDFVVANGSQYGNVFHHARVDNTDGSDSFRIEARNSSRDFSVGSQASDAFTATEILDLFEVSLTSGKTYAAVVDITSGTADLDLFAFKGSRSNGRRNDHDGSSQGSTSGTNGDETVSFTATETTIHGFAVTNENFGSSDYTFKVWLKPIVTAIGNDSTEAGVPHTGPTPSLSEGTNSVTWSLQGGPSGMTINPGTGVVSWPLPVQGLSLVTIRATNPAGFDDEAWWLTVTESSHIFSDGFELGSHSNWSSTVP